MKPTMLLCDAAQVQGGKLFVLGGGWDTTGPEPMPSAIALHVAVPWSETNVAHRLRVSLESEDGQPVVLPDGSLVEITSDFEVGRPPGVHRGAEIAMALALTIPPLPLAPGARYRWCLEIDGERSGDWCLPFGVRRHPTTVGVGQ